MSSDQYEKRAALFLSLLAIVVWIVANLPLVAVWMAHGGHGESFTFFLKHYPGQFYYLLLPFMAGLLFTVLAGLAVRRVWMMGGPRVKGITPSTVFVMAIVIGAIISWADQQGTSSALYSFPAEEARSLINDFDQVHNYIQSNDDRKQRLEVATYIWRMVAISTGCQTVQSTPVIPDFVTPGDTPDQPLISPVQELQNNVKRAYRVAQSKNLVEDQWIHRFDALELFVVTFAALHLFAWAFYLAYVRWTGSLKPVALREVQRGAMEVGMALAVLALWVPARMYSIQERLLIDPCASDINGPMPVIVAIVVTSIFVAAVFIQKPLSRAVTGVAGAISPIIITGLSLLVQGEEYRSLFGADANMFGLIVLALVLAICYLAIYLLLRIGILNDPKVDAD
ncbi:MAG: hypothetical protein O7G85_14545 [Planctomycetota bacterium]|nr:hypothetical protein [Planctomycetota bacterium]